MRVPYSWLKEFVPHLSASPEEVAEALTMAGLEVEGLEDAYDYLDRVVVGEVFEVLPHPRQEHLSLCLVRAGEKTYRVVCGAPNVAPGIKAPLALPGAVLFEGQEIIPTTIKGELSEAVLCSAAELGLDGDENGLMILPSSLATGLDLREALSLKDPVLELGITPNRGDCLSILGVAREVAAIFDLDLTIPPRPAPPQGDEVTQLAQVSIEEPDLCYRYAARVVRGVKIAPSPLWLKRRLKAVGIRPINNIVDITNYILFEVGQPLHAFDLQRLSEGRIIVRRARPGEAIITLDGVERRLDEEILVIADPQGPVAIAGVMGGAETEITDETKEVLIESACFNPLSIRRTSQKLRLSSESSYRFERGTDPEAVILGLERAASLMGELAGGQIVAGLIDVYPRPAKERKVLLRASRLKRLLGEDIPIKLAANLLERLRIKTHLEEEGLRAHIPSFRHDLSIEADFIEEVARLYGYGLIATSFPTARLEAEAEGGERRLQRRLRSTLVGMGLSEIISYSFISERWLDLLRLAPDDPRRKVVKILNPLSEDQAIMRPSLIPCLLEAARRNIFRGNPHLKLFEIGKTFIDEGQELPHEETMVAGLLTGYIRPESCHEPPREGDFFDLKGLVEGILSALKVKAKLIPQSGQPYLRPGVSMEIVSNQKVIGYLGEVAPYLREALDLASPLYIFELSFDELVSLYRPVVRFRPLPRYPATTRDLAIVVSQTIPAADILMAIKALDVPYLEEVFIFDVYQGKNIPQGYRSLGLRFIYRAPDRTLTDEEVNEIQKDLTEKILAQFKARIR